MARPPETGPWFANLYECDCGATWVDEWDCCCDDECPECGADCSPSESVELTPDKGP